MDELSASEALLAFMGWLTLQHDVAIAPELVSQFCETNNLSKPRSGWDKNVTMPPLESDSVAREFPRRWTDALEFVKVFERSVNLKATDRDPVGLFKCLVETR